MLVFVSSFQTLYIKSIFRGRLKFGCLPLSPQPNCLQQNVDHCPDFVRFRK